VGVGHPIKPLQDVGSAEHDSLPSSLIATHNPSFGFLARARSAQIGGPDGISQCFQVHTYSGEPVSPCKFARNLLSKLDWRAALPDEFPVDGPEVALVLGSELLARATEALAGEACGPDGTVFRPSREFEGEGPSANSRKEVALCKILKIGCIDFGYGSVVHLARWEQT
jgi:hypothetical protein